MRSSKNLHKVGRTLKSMTWGRSRQNLKYQGWLTSVGTCVMRVGGPMHPTQVSGVAALMTWAGIKWTPKGVTQFDDCLRLYCTRLITLHSNSASIQLNMTVTTTTNDRINGTYQLAINWALYQAIGVQKTTCYGTKPEHDCTDDSLYTWKELIWRRQWCINTDNIMRMWGWSFSSWLLWLWGRSASWWRLVR